MRRKRRGSVGSRRRRKKCFNKTHFVTGVRDKKQEVEIE